MWEGLGHPAEQSGTDERWSWESKIHVRTGHNGSSNSGEVVDGLRSDNFHRGYGRRSWVLIDRAWAKQLGVARTGHSYRISRGELMRKLADQQPATLSKPGVLIKWAGSRPSTSTDEVLEPSGSSGWSTSWTSMQTSTAS